MWANKKAKFWVRFIAKFIDVLLLTAFITLLLAFNVIKVEGKFIFKNPFNFYLWIFVTIIYIFCYFYCLPIITNGYTIGFWFMNIKIKYSKNPFKEQFIRESSFSIIYIINLLLLMTVINHTLINEMVGSNKIKNLNLSSLDNARIAFYITLSSVGVLVSSIVGISIIIKKGFGLNDSLSNSQCIHAYKFEEVMEIKKARKNKYKPKEMTEEIIEWIE